MGLTYATLEVINSGDIGVARRKLMPETDVRRAQVRMLVDSGAYMLCLNEHLQAQLGLDIIDSMEGELADGTVITMPVAGPVDLHFGNRQTSCRASSSPAIPSRCSAPSRWGTWTCSSTRRTGNSSSTRPIPTSPKSR